MEKPQNFHKMKFCFNLRIFCLFTLTKFICLSERFNYSESELQLTFEFEEPLINMFIRQA